MRAHDPLSLNAPAFIHAIPAEESARPPAFAPPASPSLDLTAALAGWDFEPGRINVRKIHGDDGRPKLQLRLDLGLLQMEVTGRPDGRRMRGFESLLSYHRERLARRRCRFGAGGGFLLSPDDCRELRDEATMYYHRFLCQFVLGDYAAALSDIRRNLEAFDFCREHAAEARDRVAMEAFRPYTLMMQARAGAGQRLSQNDYHGALRLISSALRRLKRHFRQFGGQRAYEASGEIRVLKKLARLLRRRLPESPVRQLSRQLARAVEREEYERAAVLRDQIARIS